ncbi:MAG: anti-sigma factor antagonist [Planctomycetia bacterium]|nr:anti-sigma factor antagonist [Planctomycetia bacterium]
MRGRPVHALGPGAAIYSRRRTADRSPPVSDREPPLLRMEIHIDRMPREDGVELVVAGRLDAESAGELRHAVAAEVRRGEQRIALDLAGVTFLSSAGIRVLFETQREARAAGGECLVRVASGPVRKVLELTRLDAILMRPAAAAPGAAGVAAVRREIDAAGVRLVGFERPPAGPVRGRIVGSAGALSGASDRSERLAAKPHVFAIGIAAVADDAAPVAAAGEVLAACGAVGLPARQRRTRARDRRGDGARLGGTARGPGGLRTARRVAVRGGGRPRRRPARSDGGRHARGRVRRGGVRSRGGRADPAARRGDALRPPAGRFERGGRRLDLLLPGARARGPHGHRGGCGDPFRQRPAR